MSSFVERRIRIYPTEKWLSNRRNKTTVISGLRSNHRWASKIGPYGGRHERVKRSYYHSRYKTPSSRRGHSFRRK